MVKWLVLLALLWPLTTFAQTREVIPSDLTITATLETTERAPFQQEMVLLTIHGVYKRHITLEKLEAPDLAGVNWMQLGEDHWYESELDGLKVKNFRRRMALFPEEAGRLVIGPFTHHLTLLDETNAWFSHDIQSEPITLDVRPAPQTDDWWFPVRHLEISDRWSNAPDQLGEGEGVLRVITLTGIGVSPDMMPPMPELKSPSAHIFPHPEKRLVELSPDGPVSVTFWRWTIKPARPPSAILEPLKFSYFDTIAREMREVTISAQRVGMDRATMPPASEAPPEPVVLRPLLGGGLMVAGLALGLGLSLGGRRFSAISDVLQRFGLDPDRRALRRAMRQGDQPAFRAAARRLTRTHRKGQDVLETFDATAFAPDGGQADLRTLGRQLLSALRS